MDFYLVVQTAALSVALWVASKVFLTAESSVQHLVVEKAALTAAWMAAVRVGKSVAQMVGPSVVLMDRAKVEKTAAKKVELMAAMWGSSMAASTVVH